MTPAPILTWAPPLNGSRCRDTSRDASPYRFTFGMILSSGSLPRPVVELHDSTAGQGNGGAKLGVGDFPLIGYESRDRQAWAHQPSWSRRPFRTGPDHGV